ncbi:MAG TPA: von Willebrand factor type A domain-containing protein, partial [Anaerolineales bacterium]|nr:von Willebrand factor type A domain-containing protein [Anaerolineales bacterium]
MKPLRKAIGFSVLLLLLFTSACGGSAPAATDAPAATEAPASPDYSFDAPAATEAPAAEAPAAIPQQQNGQQPPATGNDPYDMFFEDYGVNPSIDTEDDNLSTFALDVDTGSYTVM